MRKGVTLLAALVLAVGVMVVSSARADVRPSKDSKVQTVSFRAASTTPVAGYEKMTVGGQVVYVAPQATVHGDDIAGVQMRPGQGGMEMSMTLSKEAAARLTKQANMQLVVFVEDQLVSTGLLGAQASGGQLTVTGLASGEAERVARLLSRGGAPTGPAITLVPAGQVNGEYVVDVYVNNVSGLRTYQVKLQTSGGESGALTMSDIRIDDRRQDYVFFGSDAVKAADHPGARLGGTLWDGTVEVTVPKYLGTYTFLPSADARGVFQVKVVTGAESFLADPSNNMMSFRTDAGTTIELGANVSPRMNR